MFLHKSRFLRYQVNAIRNQVLFSGVLTPSRLSTSAPKMADFSETRHVIAVAQMTCTADKQKNWQQLEQLVGQALEKKAKIVFLPEGCDYIASSRKESLELAESMTGPFMSRVGELARQKKVWLSLGGVHIKAQCESDQRLSNTHILVGPDGEVKATYAKTHLFSNNIPGLAINEGDYVRPGDALVAPVPTPVGNVGLAICYDLRFPELSQGLRRLGAHVLTFPSAFTVATGRAHWHVLLRARAIECQSYVVAAAQCGEHNSKRSSYGHSLVVSPWGEVLCEVAEGVGVATAEVDLAVLHRVRREMPCVLHSRQDVAGLSLAPHSSGPRLCHVERLLPPPCSQAFGSVHVPAEGVVLRSGLSFAFSNLYPRVPGHTLVSPVRATGRVADMTEGEVSDVAQLTVMTHRLLCARHGVRRCEVALQDGPLSGQTIEHVHVHLLPVASDSPSLLSPDVPSISQSEEALRLSTNERREAMVQATTALRAFATPALLHGVEDTADYAPRELKFPDDYQVEESDCASTSACVSTRLVEAFCVAGHWQKLHIVARLRRSVASLNEVRPCEVSELLAVCHLLQRRLLQHLTPHGSTTFVIKPPTADIESVHVHILPWLEERQPSDEVYSFASDYRLQVAERERLLAAAVRRALFGEGGVGGVASFLQL